MPLTNAEIDAAVPVAGTPNRSLTNAALKELVVDVAGKASTTHTHTLAEITDAGTAAAANTGTAQGEVPLLDVDGDIPLSMLGKVPSGGGSNDVVDVANGGTITLGAFNRIADGASVTVPAASGNANKTFGLWLEDGGTTASLTGGLTISLDTPRKARTFASDGTAWLEYSGEGTGAASVVDTIADLTAIQPTPGLTVRTLGHQSVGDGGGGLFRYSNGGEATDGVEFFPYDGDVSAEVSSTIDRTAINGFALGANVAWGSVSFELDTVDFPLTLTDVHLHGHVLGPFTVAARVDYSTGTVSNSADLTSRILTQNGSTLVVRRKTISNTRRWVRVTDDNSTFHMSWLGDLATSQDGGHYLKWALTRAKAGGRKIIDFDGIKDVPMFGICNIPDGVTIKNGGVKYRSGKMMIVHRTTPAYDFSDPEYFIDQMVTYFSPDHSPSVAQHHVWEDFSVDGNIAGNLDPLQNPANYGGGGGVENTLQNSPTWSGISYINQSGREFGETSTVRMKGTIKIENTGSNCISGHGDFYFDIDRIEVGFSARNHLTYSVQGHIGVLYGYGYWWTSMFKTEQATIGNLIVDDVVENPFFVQSPVNVLIYEGLDYGDGTAETSHRRRRIGVNVESFHIDWDHPVLGCVLFAYSGGNHLSVQNGVVLPKTSGFNGVVLYNEIGNAPEGISRNISFKNITVQLRGTSATDNQFEMSTVGAAAGHDDGVSLEDIYIYNRRGTVEMNGTTVGLRSAITVNSLDTTIRNDPAFEQRRSYSIKGLSYQPAVNVSGPVRLQDIQAPNGGVVDISVRDTKWVASYGLIVTAGSGNSGSIDNWTEYLPGKFRTYWEDTFIAHKLGFGPGNFRAFMETLSSASRMTIDFSDAPGTCFSEDVGEVSLSAAGGETFIDVPTQLFWMPKNRSLVNIKPLNATAASALDSSFLSFRDRTNASDIRYSLYPGLSVRNATYQWTASGSGTSEFYLELSGGGDPGLVQAQTVMENGAKMGGGTAGSLSSGQWDWADNDTLGFDTIYVRLSDDTDPDSKAIDYLRFMHHEDHRKPIIRINLNSALVALDDVQFAWSASVV